MTDMDNADRKRILLYVLLINKICYVVKQIKCLIAMIVLLSWS